MITQRVYRLLFSLSILVGIAAACAPKGPAPQQIATYPQSPGGEWFLPAQPAGGRLVYDAYIALDVPNPEAASRKAIQIAQDYGGYLVNSYTSFPNGGESISLELRIPPHNFEAARWSFRTLGVLARETVTGEWEGGRPGWEEYAQFTLYFQRQDAPFSLRQVIGWNPGETLRQALTISARLLGFFVDLLIWVVVILGPFALIGWGVAWIARRGRESRAGSEPLSESPKTSKHHETSPEQGGNPDE